MRVVSLELDLLCEHIGIRFPFQYIYNIKQEMRRDELVMLAEPVKKEDREWNTLKVVRLNDSIYTTPRGEYLMFLTEEHPFFCIKLLVKFARSLGRLDERSNITLGLRDQLYKLTLDAKKR